MVSSGPGWTKGGIEAGMSGLGPSIPEDMYHLIKKSVRKHLERNRGDKDSKLSVQHVICI